MAVDNFFDILFLTTKIKQGSIMKSTTLNNFSHEFSLSNFIPKHLINYLCEDCCRFRIFDPSTTLFCFLYQVVNLCSTKTALLNFNIQRKKNGLKSVSMNSAAYTSAKKRLSKVKLKKIACSLGNSTDKELQTWKYKERDVFLGDGTVINLEDTKSIKKQFPITFRKGRQQGLPKMRFLCFFSASSGSFIDGEIGKYSGKDQAEPSLLKKMLTRLKKNSILVLDRFFTNYELRKELIKNDMDYVIRARDKIAKKYLKKKIDLEIFEKPRRVANEYQGMKVRYVKSTIKRKGFRISTIYILTSLLQEDGYTKIDIEILYLKRWGVELDIRHLKKTLEASTLRSKAPEQAMKELWVTLIAFNLIRKLSGKSSTLNMADPRKQCFKIYSKILILFMTGACKGMESIVISLMKSEILKSKYRREPRAVRRENRRYEVMNMSRKEAKKLKWGKSGRRERMGHLKAQEV